MKFTKYALAAALAILLLASCAKDDVTCGPGVPAPPTEITTAAPPTAPLTSDATTAVPSTTTTYAPAASSAPLPDGVAEQYALADLFGQSINRIVLTSGITGAQYTALDKDIERIADFFRPVKGIAPHSARGCYGYLCSFTLYNGPIQVGHFYLIPSGGFGTGRYETVNGHDYAVLYHINGRTSDEMWSFVGSFFPTEFTTTANPHNSDYPETTVNHVWGTAQNWGEISPSTDDFDYGSLTLPDYRTWNPVRYMGVDNRGMQSDGWQDFGLTGELRTIPQPMGSTYLYQTYSYFIRNDLTHLYPNDTIPTTPEALAEWLTEIGERGRRSLWYSIGALPNTVELTAYEELAAGGGIAIGKATYRHSGDTWTVYILCESNTASVLVIDPHDEGDYVIAVTDAIAKSYRIRTAG